MTWRSIGRAAFIAALLLTGSAIGTEAAGRTVSFLSLDGTTISAQFYEATVRPSPGVVLVHMLSRSKADWDPIAQQLADAGIAALAIDLRGHGGSTGSPGALPEMTQDVRAAVQWLSGRPSLRPDAIGVAGASLGANLALQAAAEPLVRVVAAVSPSLDYRGVRVGPDLMKKLGNKPVWLGASTDDPFAVRTIRELTADGAGAREQHFSPAAAHGTALLAADPELGRTLVDWLRQRLLS